MQSEKSLLKWNSRGVCLCPRKKNEAQGRLNVRTPKLLPEQAIVETVVGEMADAGARGTCQGTRKTVLDVFSYRRAFVGYQIVKHSVMKRLELMIGEMLR